MSQSHKGNSPYFDNSAFLLHGSYSRFSHQLAFVRRLQNVFCGDLEAQNRPDNSPTNRHHGAHGSRLLLSVVSVAGNLRQFMLRMARSSCRWASGRKATQSLTASCQVSSRSMAKPYTIRFTGHLSAYRRSPQLSTDTFNEKGIHTLHLLCPAREAKSFVHEKHVVQIANISRSNVVSN
eukprot:4063935-Amphidinium_carterae.1